MPEVGRNLANHPSYSLRYACSEPVTAYKYLNPRAALGIGLRYALSRGGALGESYIATGGYMRSDPALAVSDTIVVMAPALITRGGIGWRLGDLFPERHGFTVMVGSGRPLSRGHVLLRSSDPTAHPRIFPEYFSELEDLRALARSVRRIREMMRGPAIRDLIEAELVPGPITNDQVAIEEDIRARAATFFHPSGTCRMGSDPTAVVDPRLPVNGIEGLRRRRLDHAGSTQCLHPRTNNHDRREGRGYDRRGCVMAESAPFPPLCAQEGLLCADTGHSGDHSWLPHLKPSPGADAGSRWQWSAPAGAAKPDAEQRGERH
jgi:hypothetical protein